MSVLREIIARFGVSLDTKALDAGAKKIESTIGLLKSLGTAIGGAFMVGAIRDFVTGMAAEADALNKQASALGVSIGELQAWQYAAAGANVSADELRATLERLGAGKSDAALAQLGVQTRNANGQLRASTSVLEDVSDRLSKIKDPSERARRAAEVLGKSYGKLLPMLEGGAEGLRSLRAEFQELGGGFDEATARVAGEFNDNLGRLRVVLRGLGITIVAGMLPKLLSLTKGMVEVGKRIAPVLKNGKLLEVSLGIAAVAGVLKLSKALGPLNNTLRVLGTRILPLLVIAAVLEDIWVFMEGGDSAIGEFLDRAFGPEKTEQIRQGLIGIKEEIIEITSVAGKQLATWLEDPDRLKDDWDLFLSQLRKDIPLLDAGIRQWSAAWDVARTAAEAYFTMVRTSAETVFGFLNGLVAGFGSSWKSILESIRNMFERWVSGVLGQVGAVVELAGKLASAVGASSAGQTLRDLASDIQKASAEHRRLADPSERRFDAFFRDMPTLRVGTAQPTYANPRSGDVTVNVTVPQGTPEQVGHRIGRAAARIVEQSNRAAAAALLFGRG